MAGVRHRAAPYSSFVPMYYSQLHMLGQMHGGYLYRASPDISILPASEKMICTCQRHCYVVYFI